MEIAGKATERSADSVGLLQRSPVARRQQLRLAGLPALPHGTDGVDHPAGGQAKARGRLGVAGGTSAECAAGVEQLGSGGSVDRPVDAAAAEQRVVRRVDDGVGRLDRDVALDDLKRGAMALTVLPHGLGVVHRCERPSDSEEAAMSGLRGRGTQEWPIAPMKAMTGRAVPVGDGWMYEPKWDGHRVLVRRAGGAVDAVSSTGKPKLPQWPWLATAVRAATDRDVVLDGEVIAYDDDGRHTFQSVGAGGPRSRLRGVRPVGPRR